MRSSIITRLTHPVSASRVATENAASLGGARAAASLVDETCVDGRVDTGYLVCHAILRGEITSYLTPMTPATAVRAR